MYIPTQNSAGWIAPTGLRGFRLIDSGYWGLQILDRSKIIHPLTDASVEIPDFSNAENYMGQTGDKTGRSAQREDVHLDRKQGI